MSWNNNQTPPPSSPLHKTTPKIQQQSWDESDSPTINLYDPRNDHYPTNPSTSATIKNPINQRKVNYNQYCLPTPRHPNQDPGNYSQTPQSPPVKSPKSDAIQKFSFETSLASQLPTRMPLKIQTANSNPRRRYVSSDSAPAVLSTPKKYEYASPSQLDNNLSGNINLKKCEK